MNEIVKLLKDIKGEENYASVGRVVRYLCNVVKQSEKSVSASEAAEIKEIALSEIGRVTQVISDAKLYRDCDNAFFYGDGLLGLITLSCDRNDLTEAEVGIIQNFIKITGEKRTLEIAIDDTFERESISEQDVSEILEIADSITDEYHRGMLYKGLHEYCDKIKRLTPEAKAVLSKFVAADMSNMLKNATDEVISENLEFAVDVCKHFITEDILDLLERATSVCENNVKFYAMETLLNNKRNVSGEAVAVMAADLVYADLTYSLLSRHGKQSLFPPEYTSSEYLAKSDMVHWLVYPTELGQVPDEIQLLGKASVKKEDYYVFKFKSDSDNLSEDNKGVWLIGWANSDGGTFSNFDKLDDYVKKTPQKTVKYIAKKLLK